MTETQYEKAKYDKDNSLEIRIRSKVKILLDLAELNTKYSKSGTLKYTSIDYHRGHSDAYRICAQALIDALAEEEA